jgi:leader peptidase (prepilin peptidase)/N-methyltransferase
VELLTAVFAVHAYAVLGLTWQALAFFLLATILLVISVVDLKKSVIYDGYTLAAIALAIVFAWQQDLSLPSVLWGVLLSGGFFALLVIGSRERWMGAGDIGLGIVMGIAAGFPGVVIGLVIAFVGGSIVGILLLALRRKTLKTAIPFGPFLAAGIYVSALWGQQIMQWYLDTIGFY